ncbi:MAG: PilZ domain-containing protein [Candidatus Omnitrophica bacterium]|nr:PilZ domain-containing protein [Candidatus Omnitrophota bacterium]
MTDQTRKFPRIPVPLALSCRRSGSLADVWREVAMLNLSAGGVRFETDEPYDPFELLELRLSLPGSRAPLALRGRVVRSQAGEAGLFECAVEFVEVAPTQQAELDDLVAFLSRRIE